ncbi:terpene cyclase/mutase family protein [candidate division WOR-3 bacterium]|nr:terpene cyclase/mutase family protein [candidate division WOR-3 bacterium]
MREQISKWLLKGDPWVRYRTLRDILNKEKDNEEVIVAKRAILSHKLIKKIFNKQNKDGYWGKPKDIHTWWPKKDTTFWMLGVLADFDLTKEDKRIAKACEYVFGIQLDSGGFGWDPPTKVYDCHTAILTEALAKLGYLGDSRLQNAYNWLISRQRLDGGFWCKNTGQPGGTRENEPSCALATTFVLGALAQNTDLRNSEITKRGSDFLLKCWENRSKIKYAGHDSQIGRGFGKLKYPFTDYRILKYLDVISQFEFTKEDLRLKEIIDLLFSKQDIQGYFTPESIHKVWQDFDFGQKEKQSRWITFLAYRIENRVSGCK